jgi:hypothetical protein
MARKKNANRSRKGKSARSRRGHEFNIDSAAIAAATAVTYFIASEVSAAPVAAQPVPDSALTLAASIQDEDVGFAAPDSLNWADRSIQASQNHPQEFFKLDRPEEFHLTQHAHDFSLAPGVDGKTVMNDGAHAPSISANAAHGLVGPVAIGDSTVTLAPFMASVGGLPIVVGPGEAALAGGGSAGSAPTLLAGGAHLVAGPAQCVLEGLDYADHAAAGHGTTLETTLKELQRLGVDQVSVGGEGTLSVELGAGDWIDGALPSFEPGRTVSLVFDSSQLQQVLDHHGALKAANIDSLSFSDQDGVTLTVAQADALLGQDGRFDPGQDMPICDSSPVNVLVDNNAGAISHAALESQALHRLGIDHVDVAGSHAIVRISDAQAQALVDGGLDFSTDDKVVLDAAGTHLQTSLQQLQKLGVDAVTVSANAALTLDMGDGSQIDFGHLPAFNGPVTLALDHSGRDFLFDHLGELSQAGIDSLRALGQDLQLTPDQASEVLANGLQFSRDSEVTLEVNVHSGHGLDDLISSDSSLQRLGVDHLAVDCPIMIDDSQARSLVDAGIDFSAASDVTMNVDAAGAGTHLSTSLKDLQKLGVDMVTVTGSAALAVDLGGGGWNAGDPLPNFDQALDVTLNVGAGQLNQLGGHTDDLRTHGIDSIQVHGTAEQLHALSADQLVAAGVDGLTLDIRAPELAGLDSIIATLPQAVGLWLDKIDIAGAAGHASLVHANAATAQAMVDAGLSFEAADHIALDVDASAATHFATSADTLHTLGVDQVVFSIDDSCALDLSTLPDFDAALNVTLDISEVGAGHLPALNGATGDLLESMGIDRLQVNANVDDLAAELLGLLDKADDGKLDVIHTVMGLDAGIDLIGSSAGGAANLDSALQGLYHGLAPDSGLAGNYADLINALTASGITDLTVESGSVQTSDSLIGALAESGLLHADPAANLIVDATASGQHMFATLKDLADLDVDHVNASTSNELYINLGQLGQGDALSEVKAILSNLDPDMFSGAATPTLVLDSSTAEALSTDGVFDSTVMAGLESIGIHEVAVLVGHNQSSDVVPQVPTVHSPEVRIIGQDDDPALFDELHHPRH